MKRRVRLKKWMKVKKRVKEKNCVKKIKLVAKRVIKRNWEKIKNKKKEISKKLRQKKREKKMSMQKQVKLKKKYSLISQWLYFYKMRNFWILNNLMMLCLVQLFVSCRNLRMFFSRKFLMDYLLSEGLNIKLILYLVLTFQTNYPLEVIRRRRRNYKHMLVSWWKRGTWENKCVHMLVSCWEFHILNEI